MKGHYGEPAAGLEHPLGGVEAAHEFAEFVVHRDPQALEAAGRRMDRGTGFGPHHAGDELGELGRRLDRGAPTRLDDRAGHRARAALLAEMVEDVGERAFLLAVHEIGRARAVAAHAHVERPVLAEREAAMRLVELHRRHADIEHDPVGLLLALIGDQGVEIPEAALNQPQAAGGGIHEAGAGPDRAGIAVDGDYSDLGRGLKERARVAAGTEGAVHGQTRPVEGERGENLGQENGNVADGLGRRSLGTRPGLRRPGPRRARRPAHRPRPAALSRNPEKARAPSGEGGVMRAC
ncbi:hypothetical protein GCM10025880_24620 [Methylorubrum aminovorans]|nr:hypothetical protein GCM10025880_24620 [Methylorubrum aminovorans]